VRSRESVPVVIVEPDFPDMVRVQYQSRYPVISIRADAQLRKHTACREHLQNGEPCPYPSKPEFGAVCWLHWQLSTKGRS